ncbi:hypothetical protein TWF225_010984 [Orbilia oligospora]|nr:hypothetical protein TWF225_010984 [Orbilia oligospora]KAF3265700.1 hypothetical protein TWF217_002242 [Orbilia oligospora]KAF3271602.1 hypothetical protein TWF128_000175 [Orbilia oligospora]
MSGENPLKCFGDETLYYEGCDCDPGRTSINIIAINGFTSSEDDREPWLAVDQDFWLQTRLLKDSPNARLLVVNNRLSDGASWKALLQRENSLKNTLLTFQKESQAPVIIFCHGLGGFLVLKMVSGLNKSNLRESHLLLSIKSIILFGTPCRYGNSRELRKTLRLCATVELGIKDKRNAPKFDQETEKDIKSILEDTANLSVEFVGVSENRQTSYGPRWFKRSALLVRDTTSTPAGKTFIAHDSDHGNISRVASNSDTYNELQKHVAKWSVPLADLPPLQKTRTTVASTQIATAGRRPSTATVRSNSTNASLSEISPTSSLVPPTPITLQRASPKPSNPGYDLENNRLTRQTSFSLALPCHVIQPPKNSYFVGRGDILEELDANLISKPFKSGSDWNTRAFAIWGPPGMGKSQTALHFAYTHEKEFPSILFTVADTETKLLSDLAAYSQTIGLTTEDQSKNLPGQVKRLLEWYETTDVPWLLIFDNAKSVKLITGYWPNSKVGAIIITSRSPQFASNTVAGAGKELKSLHDEEAIQLLEKQLADQPIINFDRNEALRIARLMENLPLGIQASVGLINGAQCSLRDFNRQWTSSRNVIIDSTQDHTMTRFAKYPQALGEAWLDALGALRPESKAMIDVMALLDPDNIQEEIFEERVSLGSPSTMPFLGNKTKCLGDLKSQGLLSYGDKSQSFSDKKPYINIHRMLQHCIKWQMSENPIYGNRQTALGNASALISSLISSLWETDWIKIRKEYKNFFPHTETIRRFFHDIKDVPSMKVPISFLEMLRKAAGLCYKRNFLNLGLTILRTAEDIIELYTKQSSLKIEGTEEAILNEIIEIRYQHACISTETAEFEESLEHFELAKKSYAKFKELGYVKKNSTRYMTIVGGIANSLNGLHRNEEAEVCYLDCIELTPPGDWQPYDINICRCLWDTGIPEKLNEGADRLNTWIATRAAAFGPDDQKDYLSGHAKYILGNIRISQGKYDEAFELHMSTVKNFKAVLGDDHHKTGDAYHKAGWHFDRIGNYEEAKKYLKNALKVYQLGSDATYRSGEIARTTFKLSLVLAKMGRTQQAEDERKTAEVFRQKSMGRKYFPSDEESAYDHLVSLWAR